MNFSFNPEAETEFFEAIEYFESCEEGLGLDFSRQIYNAIRRITHFPYSGTPIDENLRRCLVKRFRYGLIYEVFDDEIFIQVVMHLNRDPEYWKSRVNTDR